MQRKDRRATLVGQVCDERERRSEESGQNNFVAYSSIVVRRGTDEVVVVATPVD